MSEFRMPSLGADMEYGTLVEWRMKPGDEIHRGAIIALVETQKGLFEVDSVVEGIVERLLVDPGSRVPVGTVMATLLQPVEKPHRPRASPLARRVAEELHVDLATVQGTGPEGAITRDDVEAAASQSGMASAAEPTSLPAPKVKPPGPSPALALEPTTPSAALAAEPSGPPATPEPRGPGPAAAGEPAQSAERAAAMRQAIASAVARSKREIPHYYLATDIVLERALAWLEAENAKRAMADRVLPAVLLTKAVALALTRYPDFNGYWIDGAFRPGGSIHVGLAVSLRTGGLIVPAVHDTDRKSIDELMGEMRDLVRRAREGGLRVSEMTDATITITNLGDQGVEQVFGVIYPPQVALVGFGSVTERPRAENGLLGVRPTVTATLAADHRASDGHRGGLFLNEINRLLQTPERL